MEYIVILSLFVLLIFVVFYFKIKQTRLLTHLNEMIMSAKNENFTEHTYDETVLSAIENNFYQYLSACATATKKMESEQESIKGLIADISHQTKTPLANILLYSELLLESDLPQSSRDSLILLAKQSDKLNFLIQSLIKASRLETGVIQLSPKLSAVDALLHDLSHQTKPRKLIIEPTDVQAVFDHKWTIEAIYNIVDNAFKYSCDSVTVKVTAYSLFCRIDIIDTGIGISEDEQAQIFTRFYRGASVNQGEGVGIGLYLARKIIQSQSGYIQVSSKLGEGSVFSVFLPMEV